MRNLTNGSGQNTGAYNYKPFGGQIFSTGNSQNDRLFTGQQYDPTGLYYLRARYYDPETGRFLTFDTIGVTPRNPQTINRYSYGYNNPVKYVDPNGHYADAGGTDYAPWYYEDEPKIPGTNIPVVVGETYYNQALIDPTFLESNPRSYAAFAAGVYSENFLGQPSLIPHFDSPEEQRQQVADARRAGAPEQTVFAYALGLAILSDLTMNQGCGKPAAVGAMRRLEYVPSPKHGETSRGNVSPAPTNGQEALDLSLQVKPTSDRRIGIDYEKREFVVFDRTSDGEFHGHVRAWNELTVDMKKVLREAGMVDSRGRILGGGE